MADSARSDQLHDLLVQDFGLQCTNLQNQYTRMHGRMQLITGLNTALLPGLGALAVAAGKDEVGSDWLLLFPAAGLLLSAIGYVAGSADHYLVRLYRAQLASTVELVREGIPAVERSTIERWAHTGMCPAKVPELIGEIEPPAGVPRWWSQLTSRKRTALSVTHLPAVLSLVFMVVWLVVLVLLVLVGP